MKSFSLKLDVVNAYLKGMTKVHIFFKDMSDIDFIFGQLRLAQENSLKSYALNMEYYSSRATEIYRLIKSLKFRK